MTLWSNDVRPHQGNFLFLPYSLPKTDCKLNDEGTWSCSNKWQGKFQDDASWGHVPYFSLTTSRSHWVCPVSPVQGEPRQFIHLQTVLLNFVILLLTMLEESYASAWHSSSYFETSLSGLSDWNVTEANYEIWVSLYLPNSIGHDVTFEICECEQSH